MLQAVIFDLDGTLIHGFDADDDTAVDLHYLSWRSVLAGYGVTMETAGYFASMSGQTNAVCEAHVRERWPGIAPDRAPGTLSDAKEHHYRSVLVPRYLRLLPGAAELLDALADGGIEIGILTNAPRENIRAAVDAVGLGRWFEPARILNGDELMSMRLGPKPAPDGLRVMANRLGGAVEACVYIGDSAADFAAARAASMRAIGIETTHDADTLTGLGASLAVADFTSLTVARISALVRTAGCE